MSLIVISRLRNLARRLAVPIEHYGAARRLLRDKIGEHDIHFTGTGLDLGVHDERDEVVDGGSRLRRLETRLECLEL